MIVLFFMLLNFSSVDERGITGVQDFGKLEVVGDVTDEVIIGKVSHPKKAKIFSSQKDSADWALIDSCSFRGRIQAGRKYCAKIDGILHPILPDEISSIAIDAIEVVPEWLKVALWDNFSRMTTNCQNTYGNLILSTSFPYQDEVAFQIARIDPIILAHYMNYTQFFVENVELIYRADSLLEYVELIEYPDYTTARYKVATNGQDTTDFEIPKEKYYWNIVHPIISDEAPIYVDRATGRERFPPIGRLWRDYLFNYPDTCTKTVWAWNNQPDTIYAGDVSPILREELIGEKILYNEKIDVIEDNGAIGRVSKWINDVMVFNSGFGYERPIQPVRIYHIHIGRCGEQSDITTAAARSALIPTHSTLTMCNDHIWSEFWYKKWCGWEPVCKFVNSTHHYEGWGWKIILPFNFRGDSWIWDATPEYTPYCTLSVFVGDASGIPVDGARVTVYAEVESNPYTAGWHFTNSDGMAQFLLGDENKYYLRVDAGSIGKYPPLSNQVTMVIDNSVAGQHYSWSHNLSGNMPTLPLTQDTMFDSTQLYKVEIDFGVTNEIIHGQTYYTNELLVKQRFGKWINDVKNIDFFICDSANFALYESDSSFKAFEIGTDVDSGNVSFVFPTSKWYVVLSNKDQVVNSEVIDVKIKFFKNQTGVEEFQKKEFKFAVLPTPFNSFASIDFTMPQKAKVDLGVYDLAGRCVKQIFKEKIMSGYHQIELNGMEFKRGVYFIRFTTPNKTVTEKIIRL